MATNVKGTPLADGDGDADPEADADGLPAGVPVGSSNNANIGAILPSILTDDPIAS